MGCNTLGADFSHNPNVLGVKKGECCYGGDSQESRAAVCFSLTCEALFRHEDRMHHATDACNHEHVTSLVFCAHFEL